MKIKKYLFLLLFIIYNSICFSQNNTEVKDSVPIYKDIKEFSNKNKYSKFFYKLIFKSKSKKTTPTNTVKKEEEKIIFNSEFEKKIIRNIIIKTYDPFGNSFDNSNSKTEKSIDKLGNGFHLKTKKITIKNLLLFNKNQVYDPLLLQESERLIRGQRFSRKVNITPQSIENNPDSLDITVKVLDSWSLIPNGNISESNASGRLTERNLFGLGHRISGNYKTRFEDKEKAISGYYSISNIKNSFLKLDLIYVNDFDNNTRRIINLKRDFFSPLTKWAGGLYFENRVLNERFISIPDTTIINNTKSEHQEYWIGKSFKIYKSNDYDSRSTRLITSVSYYKINYLTKPSLLVDPSLYFSDSNNYLAQIGISSQKYYKDKFLFNYNITEDIPYGETAAIIAGFQEKNNLSNLYLGAKLSKGKKFDFGYLSIFTEWGSFFNNGNALQTAFKGEISYISPLIELKNWKLRQFIKPAYIWGNNRDISEKDQLSLNENYGIQGFNSPILGTQKWLLSFQTQSYSPGSWLGFRFSPYFNVTLGSLNNDNENLFKNKVYSKVGIGVLINNDFLVFNSFQISFSYFPSIPFEGTNIIKTNSFENTDLSLSDFQLNKPEYIKYQ